MTSQYIKDLQAAAKKRAKIVKMRTDGKPVTLIASVLGLSRQRVYDVLREEKERAK